MDYYEGLDEPPERPPDVVEGQAVDALRAMFTARPKDVFTSKQLQVLLEDRFFHWITGRALKVLEEAGEITIDPRTLSFGGPINLIWHRRHRYPLRQAKEIMALVEKYSDATFTSALGQNGELLVSDGFGRFGFMQRGRNVREFGDKRWIETDHDLDFLFEKDGRTYGVEVKNTLSYIHDGELRLKLRLCAHIGVLPVFVVRAMPGIWFREVSDQGGFTLMLKHQLYPYGHRALAVEVQAKMGLPVDAPRALQDGTIQRLVNWHERQIGR